MPIAFSAVALAVPQSEASHPAMFHGLRSFRFGRLAVIQSSLYDELGSMDRPLRLYGW